MFAMIVLGAMAGLVVLYLLCCLFAVKQQTRAVIQRWGAHLRIAEPGLGWRWFIMDSIYARPSLRVQETKLDLETKTKDNVFAHVHLSLQYQVRGDRVEDAVYKLTDVENQLHSYVFNTVRSFVATLDLDHLFERQDDIEEAVEKALGVVMQEYGYQLVAVQVTDIDPDAEVKKEMNRINAAQRAAVAAEREGEADKIKVIKHAEAESESKHLQGVGVAKQRLAIVNGLRESVETFQKGVEGVGAHEVMQTVMLTQYLDTLRDIGATAKSSIILLPHGPAAVADLTTQMRQTLVTAAAVEHELQGTSDNHR